MRSAAIGTPVDLPTPHLNVSEIASPDGRDSAPFDSEEEPDQRLPSSSATQDFRAQRRKPKGRDKTVKKDWHDVCEPSTPPHIELQLTYPPGHSTRVGHLDEVPYFKLFKGFDEMYEWGVHCATQRGIVGSHTGARSVVLNSGYTGDQEGPNQVIMDGEGARDKNTKVHISDQKWTSIGNTALLQSWRTGAPVRVCRGSQTRYGPAEGYRYDGLWTVVNAWQARAPDAFLRCRFHLIRLPDQPLDPDDGMPALSPHLLQALRRANRAREPGVYPSNEDTPGLITQKRQRDRDEILDDRRAQKRKRATRDWDELPDDWVERPDDPDELPDDWDDLPDDGGTLQATPGAGPSRISRVEHTPTCAEHAPSRVKHASSLTVDAPSTVEHAPSTVEHAPSRLEHAPWSVEAGHSTVDRAPAPGGVPSLLKRLKFKKISQALVPMTSNASTAKISDSWSSGISTVSASNALTSKAPSGVGPPSSSSTSGPSGSSTFEPSTSSTFQPPVSSTLTPSCSFTFKTSGSSTIDSSGSSTIDSSGSSMLESSNPSVPAPPLHSATSSTARSPIASTSHALSTSTSHESSSSGFRATCNASTSSATSSSFARHLDVPLSLTPATLPRSWATLPPTTAVLVPRPRPSTTEHTFAPSLSQYTPLVISSPQPSTEHLLGSSPPQPSSSPLPGPSTPQQYGSGTLIYHRSPLKPQAHHSSPAQAVLVPPHRDAPRQLPRWPEALQLTQPELSTASSLTCTSGATPSHPMSDTLSTAVSPTARSPPTALTLSMPRLPSPDQHATAPPAPTTSHVYLTSTGRASPTSTSRAFPASTPPSNIFPTDKMDEGAPNFHLPRPSLPTNDSVGVHQQDEAGTTPPTDNAGKLSPDDASELSGDFLLGYPDE
ncbi:hypothetical protein BD626DRAFT_574177 [Schizophyllum amplum]|uniref:YDG domain-containing protein n=1 Tax=Schizophyllum amplum TaxID=97359 RepID=A0A550BZ73_9AGAR|nr:hypothetical protein BD626DRAFT_574177 [Auriculariopsis ampla]